jgi:hypothetical protein
MLDDVSARMEGAPPDGRVWVLVQGGSTVHPQGPCDIPDPNHSICRNAQFGDATRYGAGTEYKVTVVIIDPADAATYRRYYKNGFLQGDPPATPLASSPTITVRRR